MKKLTLLLLVSVLAIATLGFKCSKYQVSEAADKAAHSIGVPLSRVVREVTPKGAVHYGKTQLAPEQLAAIDAGIDTLNASAIEDGFKDTAFKPQSFYEIYTPPYDCVPSPEQHIPAFMVNGGYLYDGTEWDQYNSKGPDTPHRDPENGQWIVWKKDGLSAVFAAEMVLSFGTPGSTSQTGWMVVCPDISVLANAVRHGGDHIFLANFPYTEEFRSREPYDVWVWFNSTIIHGPDHPLLPRNGRLVETAVASRSPPTPEPSILKIEPVLADVARGSGIDVGPNDFLVSSNTTSIRPVK